MINKLPRSQSQWLPASDSAEQDFFYCTTLLIGEQNKTETITNIDIITKFADSIKTKAEGKTKTQYLISNTKWKPGIRKTYMNKLSRIKASTISKAIIGVNITT